ncbi:hypothetical protein GW17_00035691, partial [Ensete ventricosum]
GWEKPSGGQSREISDGEKSGKRRPAVTRGETLATRVALMGLAVPALAEESNDGGDPTSVVVSPGRGSRGGCRGFGWVAESNNGRGDKRGVECGKEEVVTAWGEGQREATAR